MFLVDNQLWPEPTVAKIKNIILVLVTFFIMYNVVNIYILKKAKPESGLIYKVAHKTNVGFLKAHTFIKPFQKELITSFIIAGVLIVISFILLGLPGALLLQIPVKFGIFKPITGDNAWPAALFLSFFYPLLLPLCVLIKHSLIRYGYITYSGISWIIGFGIIGIIVLIIFTFLLFNKME